MVFLDDEISVIAQEADWLQHGFMNNGWMIVAGCHEKTIEVLDGEKFSPP